MNEAIVDLVRGAWTAGAVDPALAVPLAWVVLAYVLGLGRAWRRAGVGRGVPLWRGVAGLVGLAALAAALVSPLETLAGVLFAAHMAQHLLLTVVAAPLLAAAAPAVTLLWALPLRARRALGAAWSGSRAARSWRWVTHPLVATPVFVLVLWIWHVPSLYEAAARDDVLHALEHASLVASGMAFWWSVLRPIVRRRSSRLVAPLLLFAVAAQGGILGGLIALAPEPWYPFYEAGARSVGVAPLLDQQWAGMLMWIPPGGVHLTLACWLLWRGLGDLDDRPTPPRARSDATAIATTDAAGGTEGTSVAHLP